MEQELVYSSPSSVALGSDPRTMLEKDAWLRQQEQERHERIVTVNQPMGLSPCLYFGTRRCTYSDVISVVTTVKPIPRLSSTSGSGYTPQKPQSSGSTTTASSATDPSELRVRSSNVAWAEKALSASKDAHVRACDLAFVGSSSSESSAYVTTPLAGDRDRTQRLQARQTLALSTEKHFFMTRLQETRRARLEREHSAALVIQRVHRGYVLRKRFREMKTKLQIRKRIHVSLVKVTRGTAIITGEKDRRARVLAVQSAAAACIQSCFRAWCARRVAARERTQRQIELRAGHATRIQRTWRASVARVSAHKAARRLHEQRQRALAEFVIRLFQGYSARQRVRRIRMRQQLLAAQRLQWAAQRHLADKARRLQHRRHCAEQQHAAARQIQRLVRGHAARARVLRLRICEELAIRTACVLAIQRVVRGYLGRQHMRYQRAFNVHERAWRCALHATRLVRGFLARRAAQLERVLQETDLLVQTRRGNLSTVIDLLDGFGAVDDEPADLAVVNPHTRSNVLHLAARHGHFDIVTHVVPKMLASGTPSIVVARNRRGESPLELAIAHHHEQIAAYLLATTSSLFDVHAAATGTPPSSLHSGASSTATRERSLLLAAARNGMGAIVAKLLLLFPHTFSGTERDSWTQRTALHEVLLLRADRFETPRAKSEREDRVVTTMTTILTKLPQVKIDEQDFVGFTALHLAAQLGNLRAVRLLLEYGADVTVADAHGRTAWRIALLQNHESCFLEIRRKWLDSVTSSSSGASAALGAQGSSQELDDREGSSKALVSSAARSRVAALHPQLEQALVEACKVNDLARVRFLVEECGVSINAADRSGSDNDSVLMLACRAANVTLVRYLTQQEHARSELLDVHYINSSGVSALEIALSRSSNNSAILQLLLTECALASACHPIGAKKRTVCHEVIRRGEHVRTWLNHSSAAVTPSMLVEMVDDDGRNPLHDAAAFAHVVPAKTLINVGVSVSQQSTSDRRTPLHDACRAGSATIVQRMLQQCYPHALGTAIDAQDAEGRTPFFDAVVSGSVDCLKLLLHAKAQQSLVGGDGGGSGCTSDHEAILHSQVDASGCGLLHEAASQNGGSTGSNSSSSDGNNGGGAMLLYLIAKMPNHLCDQFAPRQLTPLHVASMSGNAAAVEALLVAIRGSGDYSSNSSDSPKHLSDWRTSLQLRDSNGELAVHVAAKRGHLAVIDAFAAAGVDCNDVGSLIDSQQHACS